MPLEGILPSERTIILLKVIVARKWPSLWVNISSWGSVFHKRVIPCHLRINTLAEWVIPSQIRGHICPRRCQIFAKGISPRGTIPAELRAHIFVERVPSKRAHSYQRLVTVSS